MHCNFSGRSPQAFQSFRNGSGLTREIQNQRSMTFDLAQNADLPRQYRGGNEFKRYAPHLFAESGHFARSYGKCCLGRYVAARRTGTTSCQNEIAADVIDEFDQSLLNRALFIGNEPLMCLKW